MWFVVVGLAAQSCPTLCEPIGLLCPWGYSRQEHWSRPSFRGSSQPRDQTQFSHIAGGFFTVWDTREAPQFSSVQFSSVAQSCPTLCDPMNRSMPSLLVPSPTPGVYSNSCPSSQWCHPAISSSVVPFSSRPQSLPASGSFPVSQLFTWGGQSIGVSASASVLPMNTQD